MKPIASFGPTVSITLSPITISMVPDCTMYMQAPESPRWNTSLPALTRMLVPALRANWRMSIALFMLAPHPDLAADRHCDGYVTAFQSAVVSHVGISAVSERAGAALSGSRTVKAAP